MRKSAKLWESWFFYFSRNVLEKSKILLFSLKIQDRIANILHVFKATKSDSVSLKYDWTGIFKIVLWKKLWPFLAEALLKRERRAFYTSIMNSTRARSPKKEEGVREKWQNQSEVQCKCSSQSTRKPVSSRWNKSESSDRPQRDFAIERGLWLEDLYFIQSMTFCIKPDSNFCQVAEFRF